MTSEEEVIELKERISKLEASVKHWKEYTYLMHDRMGPLCNERNRLWLDNRKLLAEIEELKRKLCYYENRYESG